MIIVKKIFRFLRNKFVIVILAFAVWMTFFDRYDWRTMRGLEKKHEDLKVSEKQMKRQIADTKDELRLLTTDAASAEKYAREHFYMKKDNEELFIVKEPEIQLSIQ